MAPYSYVWARVAPLLGFTERYSVEPGAQTIGERSHGASVLTSATASTGSSRAASPAGTKRGPARFWAVDLHVHTPASRDVDMHAYGASEPRQIVDAAIDAGLHAI